MTENYSLSAIYRLPTELVLTIASYLDVPPELTRLALTCTGLYKLLYTESLEREAHFQYHHGQTAQAGRLPALHGMIKTSASLAAVTRAVEIYRAVDPALVDGTWAATRHQRPPLVLAAAAAGRADLVDLILAAHGGGGGDVDVDVVNVREAAPGPTIYPLAHARGAHPHLGHAALRRASCDTRCRSALRAAADARQETAGLRLLARGAVPEPGAFEQAALAGGALPRLARAIAAGLLAAGESDWRKAALPRLVRKAADDDDDDDGGGGGGAATDDLLLEVARMEPSVLHSDLLSGTTLAIALAARRPRRALRLLFEGDGGPLGTRAALVSPAVVLHAFDADVNLPFSRALWAGPDPAVRARTRSLNPLMPAIQARALRTVALLLTPSPIDGSEYHLVPRHLAAALRYDVPDVVRAARDRGIEVPLPRLPGKCINLLRNKAKTGCR
ncbi:hypothetical protein F4780DRAFT_796411 [Xylariomycetidae sp. FL0641]|nr:hypothetical protein F4780DRAFT_796411 [Xylariomycetidae sp. FL0641]